MVALIVTDTNGSVEGVAMANGDEPLVKRLRDHCGPGTGLQLREMRVDSLVDLIAYCAAETAGRSES